MFKTLIQRRLQTIIRRPSLFAHSHFPVRTMATGKKPNEELKASKLFDVSGFAAVVTGGGTGIGLSTCIAVLHNIPDPCFQTKSHVIEPFHAGTVTKLAQKTTADSAMVNSDHSSSRVQRCPCLHHRKT